MTITVNIGEADLSELLAKVEAGEDVILARGGAPVARLTALATSSVSRTETSRFSEEEPAQRSALVETILREREGRKPVTQEEIAEWKQIGRR